MNALTCARPFISKYVIVMSGMVTYRRTRWDTSSSSAVVRTAAVRDQEEAAAQEM